MDQTSKESLSTLDAILEDVTPGPWKAMQFNRTVYYDEWFIDGGGRTLLKVFGWEDPWISAEANAKFIAEARELLPILIAMIYELDDRVFQLNDQLQDLHQVRKLVDSVQTENLILKKRIKELTAQKQEYLDAQYRFDDGRHGCSALGFRAAIIGACRLFNGVTMTQMKQVIFIEAEGFDQHGKTPLVYINNDKPEMRTDTVRIGQGTSDLRYRPAYWPWHVDLEVTYNAGNINNEAIVNLVEGAGYGGVGEWRPSAPKSLTGQFGMFEIDRDKPIETFIKGKDYEAM